MQINKLFHYFLTAVFIFSISSCQKDELPEPNHDAHIHPSAPIYSGFPETMEAGSKTSYTTADVTLSTGSWNFNNALIGTSASDRKAGLKSARIQSTGMLTMNFNLTNGASLVTISHGVYGTDAASTWDLYASTNSGSTWTKIGSTITTSSTTLSAVSFTMAYSGNVRFQIRKLTGGRLNIDNIIVEEDIPVPTRDNNMAMGNPSNAVTSISSPNNYLLVKSQYALSYNNSKGIANWVSWHLSTAWQGDAPRCNYFVSDNTLPSTFFKATSSHYTNTGFDRGHLCNSEDRDANHADNQATFLMTNIFPQAPINNQRTWLSVETYGRTLTLQGYEVYIIAGGYGSGGTGWNGGVTYTIANGQITVPSRVWKVMLILPVGNNDVNRVTTSTRVIAVDMPNNQTVSSQNWAYYRVSVDYIEAQTGYNILSNLPDNIENVIEATVDSQPVL
ncbi:MAG: DNA/RNA non-specific endonuclease [Bacteroidia bacterium]